MENKFSIETNGVNTESFNAGVAIINTFSGLSLATSPVASKPPFRFHIRTPMEHFQGRRKTLDDMKKYFIELPTITNHCWSRIVAIVGPGGMGKTETAYKFAEECRDKFPGAAWINAETEQSALESFLGLAKHLEIVSEDKEKADLNLVHKVYSRIDSQDSGSILFIFDNAIRLSPDEKSSEFAIFNFLPTNDLPNKNFPYIVITSQTHDWGKQIKKFQVEQLSEKETVEFFRSSLNLKSSECDNEFRNLDKILHGYPLVMNFVASNIDYDPDIHSIRDLKQEINRYSNELDKEDGRILSEKMNRAWPTNYNKTFSKVWQVTLKRLVQEDNGHDALDVLQIMSFLHVPIGSGVVSEILGSCSECPHPPGRESQSRLQHSFRILERFYAIRVLYGQWNNQEKFIRELVVHRLVQLVVRQQMTSECKALQSILILLSRADRVTWERRINMSALQEVLERIQFSPLALPYVGILACQGNSVAAKIVQSSPPQTDCAAVIWQLYDIEREMGTLNENAIEVFKKLVGLTKSTERLMERECLAVITMRVLLYPSTMGRDGDHRPLASGYSCWWSLDGIGDLVVELILNICCWDEGRCGSSYCKGRSCEMDNNLVSLIVKLLKECFRVSTRKSSLSAERLARAWIAILARLKYYNPEEESGVPKFWTVFWEEMDKEFHSPHASRSRIAELRTSLWDQGIVTEMQQMFLFMTSIVRKQGFYRCRLCIVECMDFYFDGMNARDDHVQEAIAAFSEMIVVIGTKFTSPRQTDFADEWMIYAVHVCSVWIKLLLMVEGTPPQYLLEHLSKFGLLARIAKLPADKIRRAMKSYKSSHRIRRFSTDFPQRYCTDVMPRFIQKYSYSDVKQIETLVTFCCQITAKSR